MAWILLAAIFPQPGKAADFVKIPATATWRGKPIELTGYYARPAGDKAAPAVILMHGCGGLRTTVLAALDSHARHLNASGFATLILDSFEPRGVAGGYVCERLSRLASARDYRMIDATDAAGWLKSRPEIDGGNIFLMGQSNGGSVALKVAAKGDFRAVAAYYPWCGAALANRSPLIIFGGGKDDWVPPDQCGWRKQNDKYRFIVYPEAAHSFDVRSGLTGYLGHRIGYNAAATADSRKRMIAFFRKHMR